MSDIPTPIKFYTDTHIAKAVAIQLRNRGIDVIRCEEVGLAETDDFQHLEYAAREGRVLITNDDDFLGLDKMWRLQGKPHAGIMYCRPHVQGEAAIGIIVRECIGFHEMISGGVGTIEDDIVNQIIYVS